MAKSMWSSGACGHEKLQELGIGRMIWSVHPKGMGSEEMVA